MSRNTFPFMVISSTHNLPVGSMHKACPRNNLLAKRPPTQVSIKLCWEEVKPWQHTELFGIRWVSWIQQTFMPGHWRSWVSLVHSLSLFTVSSCTGRFSVAQVICVVLFHYQQPMKMHPSFPLLSWWVVRNLLFLFFLFFWDTLQMCHYSHAINKLAFFMKLWLEV